MTHAVWSHWALELAWFQGHILLLSPNQTWVCSPSVQWSQSRDTRLWWRKVQHLSQGTKQGLPREMSITSVFRWHHPYGRKWRGTKEPLDESERGEWKSWLKTQPLNNEDCGIWPHHFMVNRWGNNGNSERLYFSGLNNHCRWWLQPWN